MSELKKNIKKGGDARTGRALQEEITKQAQITEMETMIVPDPLPEEVANVQVSPKHREAVERDLKDAMEPFPITERDKDFGKDWELMEEQSPRSKQRMIEANRNIDGIDEWFDPTIGTRHSPSSRSKRPAQTMKQMGKQEAKNESSSGDETFYDAPESPVRLKHSKKGERITKG